MVKSQRDRPGRAAGVCACVYLSHVTRCVQSAAVKRNKMQVLVLVCSTEYPLCVLVLVSQSVFYRVKLARSVCLHLCRELVRVKLISLMVLESRWRSVHAARPPSWQRCCQRCR